MPSLKRQIEDLEVDFDRYLKALNALRTLQALGTVPELYAEAYHSLVGIHNLATWKLVAQLEALKAQLPPEETVPSESETTPTKKTTEKKRNENNSSDRDQN